MGGWREGGAIDTSRGLFHSDYMFLGLNSIFWVQAPEETRMLSWFRSPNSFAHDSFRGPKLLLDRFSPRGGSKATGADADAGFGGGILKQSN